MFLIKARKSKDCCGADERKEGERSEERVERGGEEWGNFKKPPKGAL